MANSIPGSTTKRFALCRIANNWVEKGELIRALEIAKVIPADSSVSFEKLDVLCTIIKRFINLDDIAMAIKIVNNLAINKLASSIISETLSDKKIKFINITQIVDYICNEMDKKVVGEIFEILIKIGKGEEATRFISDICKELIKLERVNIAIEIAHPRYNYRFEIRTHIFKNILTYYLNLDDITKIRQFAYSISNERFRKMYLLNVFEKFLEINLVEAIEIANGIPSGETEGMVLWPLLQKDKLLQEKFFNIVINKNDIKNIIDLTNCISDEDFKEKFTLKMCQRLLELKRVDHAIELSKSSYGMAKQQTLCNISIYYLGLNDIEKATEFAYSISIHILKGECLFAIFNYFTQRNLVEAAIKVEHDIPSSKIKGRALWWLYQYYSKQKNIKKMLEIADCPEIRMAAEACQGICMSLADLGYFPQLIKIVKALKTTPTSEIDQTNTNPILSALCRKLISSNNFEIAHFIAEQIPDQLCRENILIDLNSKAEIYWKQKQDFPPAKKEF